MQRPQTAQSNYNAPKASYQTMSRPQSSMGNDRPSSSYSQASRQQRAGGRQRTDDELLTAVRDKLKSRGTRSICALGRSFKIFDDNGDRKLDHQEGAKAIHDMRVGLDKDECMRVFKIFDRNGDGYIDYDEFLYGVRGEMNQFRKNICMKAFKKLDLDNSNHVTIDDIKHIYNAKKHPDVISGKKTEDDVLFDFLETFDTNHQNNHADIQDAEVTPDEWIEYYNNVSISIDDDAYFEVMMNNAWNLDNSRVTKKGWGGQV